MEVGGEVGGWVGLIHGLGAVAGVLGDAWVMEGRWGSTLGLGGGCLCQSLRRHAICTVVLCVM